ncbi:MAG: dinitrogenase iron-molybdenum cofactor biosynthesis protein [Treponema sp.]|jgi:predicted Fe-Mo cluster-binding NifX family protein|nr:dinitrogenase iron-molybdenum cofactor biosynthesis protein [Treponema sp.]
MKIAISATGKNKTDTVDQRFGRTSYFVVYDTEDDSYTAFNNEQNLHAAQGAGIQSAQNVIQTGASAVITGHTGPKAFRVLQAANIPIYLCPQLSLTEAIEKFKKGELVKINAPDVEGHWA